MTDDECENTARGDGVMAILRGVFCDWLGRETNFSPDDRKDAVVGDLAGAMVE
jgi:hypothetical protein